MRVFALGTVVSGALAACGARGEPAPADLPPVDTVSVRAADSLVLTLQGGATVWFTEGRKGADSSGATCVERTIEIRRDTVRLKVPLLYARTAPTRVDDTSFVAELSLGCRPMSRYRVSIRDGMPRKLP